MLSLVACFVTQYWIRVLVLGYLLFPGFSSVAFDLISCHAGSAISIREVRFPLELVIVLADAWIPLMSHDFRACMAALLACRCVSRLLRRDCSPRLLLMPSIIPASSLTPLLCLSHAQLHGTTILDTAHWGCYSPFHIAVSVGLILVYVGEAIASFALFSFASVSLPCIDRCVPLSVVVVCPCLIGGLRPKARSLSCTSDRTSLHCLHQPSPSASWLLAVPAQCSCRWRWAS